MRADSLSASFAKCLDLRDKYLSLSNQRLGDNPRDHDGTFSGFSPRSMGDALGVRPEADPSNCEEPALIKEENTLPPWRIIPPPPPPHWHWRPSNQGEAPHLEHRDSGLPDTAPKQDTRSGSSGGDRGKPTGKSDMDVFDIKDFEIPGNDPRWTYQLNEEGVYEIISSSPYMPTSPAPAPTADARTPAAQSPGHASPMTRLARVPSLKEYFSDLDFLLNVCSDGPAKSFAFRRLKYLASKWSLYCLLNEYQELADMKAVPHR